MIDTAPHAADAALGAARAANAVLIPCRASAADLTAISATIDVARLAGRPAYAILNAVPGPEPARRPSAGSDRAVRDRNEPDRYPPTDRPRPRVDEWPHSTGTRPAKQSCRRDRGPSFNG